ncbi:hypothetical protein O0544_10305 [Edwardsiella anguillarum]|nr:hypothetical protein [Edwardsiella anguillarum]
MVYIEPTASYSHSLERMFPLSLSIGVMVIMLFIAYRWLRGQTQGSSGWSAGRVAFCPAIAICGRAGSASFPPAPAARSTACSPSCPMRAKSAAGSIR